MARPRTSEALILGLASFLDSFVKSSESRRQKDRQYELEKSMQDLRKLQFEQDQRYKKQSYDLDVERHNLAKQREERIMQDADERTALQRQSAEMRSRALDLSAQRSQDLQAYRSRSLDLREKQLASPRGKAYHSDIERAVRESGITGGYDDVLYRFTELGEKHGMDPARMSEELRAETDRLGKELQEKTAAAGKGRVMDLLSGRIEEPADLSEQIKELKRQLEINQKARLVLPRLKNTAGVAPTAESFIRSTLPESRATSMPASQPMSRPMGAAASGPMGPPGSQPITPPRVPAAVRADQYEMMGRGYPQANATPLDQDLIGRGNRLYAIITAPDAPQEAKDMAWLELAKIRPITVPLSVRMRTTGLGATAQSGWEQMDLVSGRRAPSGASSRPSQR